MAPGATVVAGLSGAASAKASAVKFVLLAFFITGFPFGLFLVTKMSEETNRLISRLR
jgi:hypothetical protein